MVLPVTTTSSQIVRCPAIPTIPAMMQRRPTEVLPEIPAQPAITAFKAVSTVTLKVSTSLSFSPRTLMRYAS